MKILGIELNDFQYYKMVKIAHKTKGWNYLKDTEKKRIIKGVK